MANYLDNIDIIDALNNPTNIILQDRQSLALSTEALAKANTSISKLNNLSIYNVKDYGATGDGSTDDTASINSAIAAYNTTGGVLYFPAGVYIITDELTTIDKSGSILSAGAEIDSDLNSNEVLLNLNSVDISVSDFYIKGTAGIAISTYSRCDIKNCVFDGFERHISIDDSVLVLLFGNYFTNSTLESVAIENTMSIDSGDNRIIANTWDWSSNGQIAIALKKGGGLIATDNKILNCSTAFYEAIDEPSTSILIFSNNSIESFNQSVASFQSPLNVAPFGKCIISNNEIAAITSQASCFLFSDYSDNIIISENYIQGSLTDNYYVAVFGVSKTARNVSIHDNNIQFYKGFILMYLNPPYLSVKDNEIDFYCVNYINSVNITALSPEIEMSCTIKDPTPIATNENAAYFEMSPYSLVHFKITIEDNTSDYAEFILISSDSAITISPIISSINSKINLNTSGLAGYIKVTTDNASSQVTITNIGQLLKLQDLDS